MRNGFLPRPTARWNVPARRAPESNSASSCHNKSSSRFLIRKVNNLARPSLELCHTILTIPKVLKLYTINKVEVSPVAIFPPVDIPPLVNYLEQLLSRRDEASLLSGRSETGYSEPNSARRRACCGFAFAETTKLRVFSQIRETQQINTGC